MDYLNPAKVQVGAQLAASAVRAERPMERISFAADRAADLVARVACILSRFRNDDRTLAAGDGPDATHFSYLDHITRLHGNLDHLEKLTEELGELA